LVTRSYAFLELTGDRVHWLHVVTLSLNLPETEFIGYT